MAKDLKIERRIKKFFEKRKQIQLKSVLKLFSEDLETKDYCEKVLAENNSSDILKVVKSIVLNLSAKHCKTCGKALPLCSNGDFCSAKCRNSDKDKISKAVKHFHETILNDIDRRRKVEIANEKRRKTCLEKRKLKILENKDEKLEERCKIKQKEQFRLHQIWKTIQTYSSYIAPMFNEEDLCHLRSFKTYKWKCTKCGNEFESHIHRTMHVPEFPYLPRCLKCYPYLSGFSNKEKELLELVKSYFPDAHKDRKLINPLELDIVIDELKLAIEFNGNWFHSLLNTPKGFHLQKTKLCNEKGYRLIHIWEDVWDLSKEAILAKLAKILKREEPLSFEDNCIKLDRSWFNGIEIPGYALVSEVEPSIVIRDGNEVEDCGYLVYKKVQDL